MVAPTAQPPVAKIVDYGKHKYLEGKLKKDKKPKQQELKGIKISPRIAEHDLGFLTKNAIKFLAEGHKVKVTCQFKAREVTHPELGKKKLSMFAEVCKEYANVEREPTLDGKMMIMVLLPKPGLKDVKKNHAKAEDKQDGGQEVQDHGDGEDHPPSVAQ
jgi:translation initiation factor IF-3